MKISVIGCGYLGAVHAASLASFGHQVIGVDHDERKIEHLSRGFAPFFEAGLEPLLKAGLEQGRLSFSTDFAALAEAELHFICVGTPQSKTTQEADLSSLLSVVEGLHPYLRPGTLVVGKSTVPVGTAAAIAEAIAGTGAVLAWNPEFLRQGSAVADSLQPDRLVYGIPKGIGAGRSQHLLDQVYAPILAAGVPRLVTDLATAELTKVAANAFLALKLSYINAVGELCEATGADVTELARALGLDERIGAKYLAAGAGFGGGCLPKDIRSFRAQAAKHGIEPLEELMSLIDGINADARYRIAEAASQLCSGTLAGKKIAILGAAFKPNTDDIRDSPALDVALQLAQQGAEVVVTDPQAVNQAWLQYPQLRFETQLDAALQGAELVVLMTEWQEYRQLQPAAVASLVARPVLLDGRNALDAASWRAAGWRYRGIGVGSADQLTADIS
ncbi:UDP-glucose dehydrogenase family protein [Psychromicrobium lacuslunae]|uniref:UDP-glucose 6-dehydrogenase n=1 Tax=Psychromicrobium lacuslunae TaxID=1618207 RepID=A0A0D4BXG7_9MICC|nr:UDP-glucose/GDP-mannose dehydrogenase family protein [Psychromicrobium lacuslunae]AJT40830.1 UDP-glucose 6-dehydrogenase [Psychromicrobium lacuslunae]